MKEHFKEHFKGIKKEDIKFYIDGKEVNGRECYVYKVYLGSSKMDTKEMTELLDITLQICGELGIPTEVDFE